MTDILNENNIDLGYSCKVDFSSNINVPSLLFTSHDALAEHIKGSKNRSEEHSKT